MKQKTQWILTVLMAIILCTGSMVAAFAEEDAVTLDLPISVQVHGATTGTATPTTVLTLLSLDGGPMPEEADGDDCRFEISGSGKVTLHFTFTESGEWQYELSAVCSTGEITPEKLIITITVMDIGGTGTLFVIAETEDGKKCDLVFQIELQPPGPTPPPPKTGDDSHLGRYIAAASISFLLIVYLIIQAKRRKRM